MSTRSILRSDLIQFDDLIIRNMSLKICNNKTLVPLADKGLSALQCGVHEAL